MYGYPLANIRVLVGTYSNAVWDPMVAGTDVTYDTTMTDLDNTLAAYATGSGDPHELGANDNLFIFTFNHGGNDGDGLGSYLCCDNFTNNYYASDFAARIGVIHCKQVVLLAPQCMSGGFVDPFINALWSGTRGAVMAGSRSDQTTYEAVCDKLYASAFNGRMIQDTLDDNIDLGITGEGTGVYVVPGYKTERIDWGPTGGISTREAFNWVYDHYINEVYPNYAQIDEVQLYKQKPWMESGHPLHIRLGEPDLVMQDNSTDTGVEPSSDSPWHSPDLYPDNTDQFPLAGQYEYVPAHDNRFFVRTANRGTAPTDDVWRNLEVRGLGFTGGPVGPPRIDRATETSGGVTESVRLRPGRAHTQYYRILIGDDFGHGCVSAAAWCGTNPMEHDLWNIRADNDQVQCNLNPATISGLVPVDSGSINTNAGKIIRTFPIIAEEAGTFELHVEKPEADFPVKIKVEKSKLTLKKGQTDNFNVEIAAEKEIKDGAKGQLTVTIYQNGRAIGGTTFLLTTATAFAEVAVYNYRSILMPKTGVTLQHPGDFRVLIAQTNSKGIAHFGPLNPGFYFAQIEDSNQPPVRLFAAPSQKNVAKLIIDKSMGRYSLAARNQRLVTSRLTRRKKR